MLSLTRVSVIPREPAEAAMGVHRPSGSFIQAPAVQPGPTALQAETCLHGETAEAGDKWCFSVHLSDVL